MPRSRLMGEIHRRQADALMAGRDPVVSLSPQELERLRYEWERDAEGYTYDEYDEDDGLVENNTTDGELVERHIVDAPDRRSSPELRQRAFTLFDSEYPSQYASMIPANLPTFASRMQDEIGGSFDWEGGCKFFLGLSDRKRRAWIKQAIEEIEELAREDRMREREWKRYLEQEIRDIEWAESEKMNEVGQLRQRAKELRREVNGPMPEMN